MILFDTGRRTIAIVYEVEDRNLYHLKKKLSQALTVLFKQYTRSVIIVFELMSSHSLLFPTDNNRPYTNIKGIQPISPLHV